MRLAFLEGVIMGGYLLCASGLSAQGGKLSGRVVFRGTGVPDVVVALRPLDEHGGGLLPGHGAVVNQVRLSFLPQVVAVSPGAEVRFENSDPLMHNVFGPGGPGGDRFDLGTYPAGTSRGHRFDTEGIHVVLCNIHPEMVAYVVVRAAPYVTVTRPDGSFEFADVPPGRYAVEAVEAARPLRRADDEWVVPGKGLGDLVLELTSGKRGSL